MATLLIMFPATGPIPALLALTRFAQPATPCGSLPLVAGSAWRYQAEVANGATHRSLEWTTTVRSVASNDSALAATVEGWPTDLAWWEPGKQRTVSVLFCTGGRLYLLRPVVRPAAELAAALLAGREAPSIDDLVLELPLHTGDLFGRDRAERHDTFYAWFVESAEPVAPDLRRLRPGVGDSLYAVVYRTNPDYTLVGFVPGLGIAHYVYHHNGTPAEADARLVGYDSGR